MKPLPQIQQRGAAGLVLWLRRDQPAIYSRLVQTVPAVAQIETLIQQQQDGGLGWLAQVGSAIAGFAKTALPKLVEALPQIASTAVDVAGQVYVAKQQAKLVDAQIKQAQANQPPLATAQVPGQQIAIVDPVTGQYVTQPAVVAHRTLIPGVPDPVTYVGGGLLLLLLARRIL